MRENLLPDVPDPARPDRAGRDQAPRSRNSLDPPRNQTLSIAIPR